MLDSAFPIYLLTFLFTLVFTVFLEKKLIPALRKKAAQPIYTEGPEWHIKKEGTPTMGGIAFLIAITLGILISVPLLFSLSNDINLLSLIITLGFALSNSLIGIFDDIKKLVKKENKGLSAVQKLFFQVLSAIIFLYLRHTFFNDGTEIAFSFGSVDLGILYYPISIILLVGIINCANLTDGIDGLASSVAFSAAISLLYISAALFTEVALISSAIIGATLGFLIFNIHPAKIFMGDTGSLFFGALIASLAFTLNNPLIVIFVGGIYVIEGVSVILQVLSFKLTGKRIFKMAPLHHHLEKCGWSENRICITAILLTFLFSVPVYIFYLP